MARKDISPIHKLGNEERAQSNFVELYAAIGGGVVSTADIASAVNVASAQAASALAVSSANLTSAINAVGGGSVVGTVHVKDYGAIADGSSHPLSGVYGTLASAQTVYPFATALAQEIDFCACQKASNIAFGTASAEHGDSYTLNQRLHINAGSYQFGADTWKIRNLGSSLIEGDGKLVTALHSSATAGVMAFDGIWYSKLTHFGLYADSSACVVALDIDGNVAGAGTTRGIQGNVFEHMLFTTNGGHYCVAMGRQGTEFQGSENIFDSCHFSGATLACYYQTGFNALDNIFLGGDMQSFAKYGIDVVNGTVSVYGMSFEAGDAISQYQNNGWDIHVNGGVDQPFVVQAVRTEGMRLFWQEGNATNALVSDCTSVVDFADWATSSVYAVDDVIHPLNTAAGRQQIFICTDAGTSNSVEPTWPAQDSTAGGAIVIDNGATWKEVLFEFVHCAAGFVDRQTVRTVSGIGSVVGARRDLAQDSGLPITSSPYYMAEHHRIIGVDASAANIDVYLPYMIWSGDSPGTIVHVVKVDTSAHTVSVHPGRNRDSSTDASVDPTVTTYPGGMAGSDPEVIAGGAVGSRTFIWLDQPGSATPPLWYVIGST